MILNRRARREIGPDGDLAAIPGWIDEIVADFIRLGLLNDTVFAAAVAARGRVNAKAPRRLRASIRGKGVSAAIAAAAVPDDSEAEWSAAVALARRRRLGPYRESDRDAVSDRRDLGILGRAGIGFAIAKRLISRRTPPE